MSLIPILIAMILARGENAPNAARRGKRGPGWPGQKSPPPSGTDMTIGPVAMAPMPPMPPMPAETPATPLGDLHAASQDSPQKRAAQALYQYVTSASPNWGFPGRPSGPIKTSQTNMRGVVDDGIYGPKTQARCAALLGHSCPPRPGAKNAAASAAKGAASNKAKSAINKGVPKLRMP